MFLNFNKDVFVKVLYFFLRCTVDEIMLNEIIQRLIQFQLASLSIQNLYVGKGMKNKITNLVCAR